MTITTADEGSPITIAMRVGFVWDPDELPPNTIALDGAVAGPLIDPERRCFSFDHHQGCIRLITSATCKQVLDALLLGLDPSGTTVLLNDVDADTVLSVWLLQHHQRLREPAELDRVRRLVTTIGECDAHGPAFPVPQPDIAQHFHVAILKPVREARPVPGRDMEALATLEACLLNLEAWWAAGLVPSAEMPRVESVPELTQYEDWVLADAGFESPGRLSAGLPWLYARGFDRAVLCTQTDARRYRYTIARRSDLVANFPLLSFYDSLNEAEQRARGAALGAKDRWGGGTSIGGSPRDGGSVLVPDQVARIIATAIKREKR